MSYVADVARAMPNSLRRRKLEAWLLEHGAGDLLSSNVESASLPFQRWFHFKEAFSPKLVLEILEDMPFGVERCVDPFGGSGTTALTCAFLGIPCQTIEVNPFIADLIESKTALYDDQHLSNDMLQLFNRTLPEPDFATLVGGPASLVEPGLNGRWVFSRSVAERILAYRQAIDDWVSEPVHRRFFRIMLGSILIETSNVVISGKGRRYRRGWERRSVTAEMVSRLFRDACMNGLRDIMRFSSAVAAQAEVLRGDARVLSGHVAEADCAIFSPPYPNSFDYTDVYNLELWMLGYLKGADDNRRLRCSTLHSHVQIKREYRAPIANPATLQATLDLLHHQRADLWHRDIPNMISSYFADMEDVIAGLTSRLRCSGRIAMVVGGSSYAGIGIDTPQILIEIAEAHGLSVSAHRSLRAMRQSAQQGGQHALAEDLVVLQTPKTP